MTTPRSSTAAIICALNVLGAELDSPDGVANATCYEAAGRIQELLADLAVVLPAVRRTAERASRRDKAGRAFRAAANRLAGEVLA